MINENLPNLFNKEVINIAKRWIPYLGADGVYYAPSIPESLTVVSGAVSQLNDISGNNIHLAQPTNSKRPTTGTRSINGVNVLDFVPANLHTLFDLNNAIATALSGTNKAFAIYAVAQRDNAANTNRVIGLEKDSTSTPLISLYINSSLSNKISVQKRDDANNLLRADGVSSVDTNPHIISARFDAVNCKIYLDGSLESTTDLSTGQGVMTLNTIRMGNFFEIVGNYFDGGIGDTLILTSNPTDDLDSKINGYFAWKYKLHHQLDYNQAYRFDGRIFGSYKLWKPTTADIASLVHIEPNAVANVTRSAGAVSQLTTVQGSLTLAQATGSKQPSITARTINGIRALDFIAANSQRLFDVTNAIATALSGTSLPFAMYAVVQRDIGSATQRIFVLSSSSSANPQTILFINATNQIEVARRDDALNVKTITNIATAIDTNPHVISCRFDGVTIYIYIDGTLVYSADGSTGVGAITLNQAEIGSFRDTASQFFDGAIGSVLAMAENPSDAMHEKLEGFLAHQYKLTANLPSNHPYKTNPPME